MATYVQTSAPHIRSEKTTAGIYWLKSVALAPILFACLLVFGFHALKVFIASILFSCLAESLGCFLNSKPQTFKRGVSVYEGIFFALILSPVENFWYVGLAIFCAMLFYREMLGGIGASAVPIAFLAKLFLILIPSQNQAAHWALIQTSLRNSWTFQVKEKLASLMPSEMVQGIASLSLHFAEVSLLALVLAVLFLLVQRVVKPELACLFFAGFFFFAWNQGTSLSIISAGIFLSFFSVMDSFFGPISKTGKRLFSLLAGLGVGSLMKWMHPFEAACFVFLSLHFLTPWFDHFLKPKQRVA